MEFPKVLVFGLGISKESNTILWNLEGCSFILSGISKNKLKKNEKLQVFFNEVCPQPPLFVLFWNRAICICHYCLLIAQPHHVRFKVKAHKQIMDSDSRQMVKETKQSWGTVNDS